MIYFLFPV